MIVMIPVVFLAFVYLVFAVCMTVTMIAGWKKGLYPTLLRLGVMLSSAVVAFFLARALHNVFSNIALKLVLHAHLSADIEHLMETSDAFAALINILGSALLLPFVFVILFAILEIVGTIVCKCTTKKMPKGNRSAGLGVGVLRGVLLTVLLLFPLLAYTSITDTVLDHHPMLEEDLQENLGDELVETLELVSDGDVLYVAFGKNIVRGGLHTLTVTDLNGMRVDVYDALHGLAATVESIAPMTEDEPDLSHLSDEDLAHLKDTLAAIDESDLLADLVSDIISPAADAWADGATFADLASPLGASEGKEGEIYQAIYEVLSTSDRDTVTDDLCSLFEIAVVLEHAAEESMTAGDDAILHVCKHGSIDDLLEPFAKNPHMTPVVPKIMSLGMWALAQNVHSEIAEEGEAYTELVTTISDIVLDAEMDVDTVSDEIYRLITEHGMNVSKDIADSLARALVDHMKNTGGVLTEENMEEVLATFADQYADVLAQYYDQMQGNDQAS